MNTVLATTNPASDAQLGLLRKLFVEKFDAEKAAECAAWLDSHRLSKATASDKISKLLAMPTVNRAAELEEGMYKLGEEIFKVYFTQAGHIATKKLTEDGFEYTGRKPLAEIKPEHRMTLDEAKAYGKVTGTCCNCGRLLTNEDSIEAGIGPICAGKF